MCWHHILWRRGLVQNSRRNSMVTQIWLGRASLPLWARRANEIDSWFKLQVRLTFEDFPFAIFFSSQNTSPSHENLRRVSKSPLLHPFTCCRSGTLDWCVTRSTSADSSRLIHTIFAHSSTLHYRSTLCHHRTSWIQAPFDLHHELQPFEAQFCQVLCFRDQVLHHHYRQWLRH